MLILVNFSYIQFDATYRNVDESFWGGGPT